MTCKTCMLYRWVWDQAYKTDIWLTFNVGALSAEIRILFVY